MNWIDFILASIILFGIVRGLMKGFVLEVASFVGVIIGIFIARMFYVSLALKLEVWLDINLHYAKPLAFVIIFFAMVILAHLVARVISKLVKAIALGWLNKLLGAVFGAFKFVIILSITITAIEIFNAKTQLISKETIEKSILYKPIENVLPFVMPYLKTETTDS